MTRLTSDGDSYVLATGFVAYGESNQSDGFGPHIELGSFTTATEALAAVQHKGIQGDPGYIHRFQWVRYVGGAIARQETPVYARHRDEQGTYTVGWLHGKTLTDFDPDPEAVGPLGYLGPVAFLGSDEFAARFIAATSWPLENQEARDQWAPRLLNEPEMLAKEAAQARKRLDAAIARVTSALHKRQGESSVTLTEESN